ncbi:LacI family DNA-binding transcriptional regulator [Sphingobacterium litopenaei]|uniref:LacI family DNA-binding transcriptional regulator n=1 Tax=Sphingobacterium litopenaei TaxID=2763500 RepID=A0ABR7YHB8_9SPHI|nr:LacI family DNA-binding transcriptional regulator [Sphingobacterium litopenaei]MBD1430720.1 LacI family DNA-binding transcriptional regulator [Sphingobacterium litopenaei]
MSKVDIISIAKALNLSKSTVSRAFQEKSDINPNTRNRILAYANEVNYRPNHYASNLREQKSKTIAVVVPELENNYFTQIIKGAEKIAKQEGYHILIYATDDDINKEREFITSISNGKVDGVLMSVVGERDNHSYLHNIDLKKMPIVFFDRVYDDIDITKIVTDDYQSSFDATEHLILGGCKSIAYLVVDKDHSIGKERALGYKDALKKHKIAIQEDLIVDCSNSYDENFKILKELLINHKPDAVFSSVERLAFSTYFVCNDLGLKIPKDLKVVAFSSLQIAELLSPPLSTVTQPAEQIGQKAAKLLLNTLKGEPQDVDAKTIILKSELRIRKSSQF